MNALMTYLLVRAQAILDLLEPRAAPRPPDSPASEARARSNTSA